MCTSRRIAEPPDFYGEMTKIIQTTEKKHCSGCLACMNECPVKAISVFEDEEGFPYPVVNEERCIHCNLCEKVCPYNKDYHGVPSENMQYKEKYFAAQLKDQGDLFQVSSGGAFWAFAKSILCQKGVIYGAVQEDVGTVRHIRAVTLKEAEKVRRSKYLQSDIGWTYQMVKKDLNQGLIVLFSGTGCQIAGLYGYLKDSYNNLYTCEVVCHGVPSTKIWQSYQKEKEHSVGSPMKSIIFRDKSLGWSKNQYKITYNNGLVELGLSTDHAFHFGYLQGFFYRPSCGICPFAKIPRTADITLADYWSYKGPLRIKSQDLGISLITINNTKGEKLLTSATDLMIVEPTDKARALSSCHHLNHVPSENKYRHAFIELALKDGYNAAYQRYLKHSLIARLWLRTKNIIRKFFKYMKGLSRE